MENLIYSTLEYFGTIRQRVRISQGMTVMEEAVTKRLEESGDFGVGVLNNGSRKHALRINDNSRKKSTYDVDAVFYDKNTNTVTLVDVKPNTKDNSTPSANHAVKFIDAFETYKKDHPGVNVRFIIAVGGNATTEDCTSSYYNPFVSAGIEIISMKDQYGFCEQQIDDIRIKHTLSNFTKFSERAVNSGASSELHEMWTDPKFQYEFQILCETYLKNKANNHQFKLAA